MTSHESLILLFPTHAVKFAEKKLFKENVTNDGQTDNQQPLRNVTGYTRVHNNKLKMKYTRYLHKNMLSFGRNKHTQNTKNYELFHTTLRVNDSVCRLDKTMLICTFVYIYIYIYIYNIDT